MGVLNPDGGIKLRAGPRELRPVNIDQSYDAGSGRRSLVPGVSQILPATVIAGRYELRDLIGSGAGGRVYEAYDRRLRRLVALKLMPVKQADTQDAAEKLRRFRFEAQAVSRLSHPHIITVHDFGHDPGHDSGHTGGYAWIVMQLVIGETLEATLRQQGALPLEEAVRLITALLAALDCAHGRGIVHGDVKPANILIEISATEPHGEMRLSDFGVARMTDEQPAAAGDLIGTPSVMAPEQVRGEAGDARIDIWAAGVILYEMLVGERPFKGTHPALFHRIQTLTPTPPTSLRPDLPAAFDAVIARALAKRPEDRFASAQDMADAVRVASMATAVDPSALPAPSPPQAAPAENGTLSEAAAGTPPCGGS
jgi:serine/threonine-protein kinase